MLIILASSSLAMPTYLHYELIIGTKKKNNFIMQKFKFFCVIEVPLSRSSSNSKVLDSARKFLLHVLCCMPYVCTACPIR